MDIKMIDRLAARLRNGLSRLWGNVTPPSTDLAARMRSLERKVDALSKAMERQDLHSAHGVLKSTKTFDDAFKREKSLYVHYSERAHIALIVAGHYPGGDYLEFGSDGMGTFRNFLSAYDLNALDTSYPDTRFHAFDIFGSVNASDVDQGTEDYFASWTGPSKKKEALSWIQQHGLYGDRCYVHAGLFQQTVPAVLTEYASQENDGKRTIGFAFLDCNITPSYRFLFDHLVWGLKRGGFIYMDEYYLNTDVPPLFRRFGERLLNERKIETEFVTNAGTHGALFKLMGAKYDPSW